MSELRDLEEQLPNARRHRAELRHEAVRALEDLDQGADPRRVYDAIEMAVMAYIDQDNIEKRIVELTDD